MKELQDILAAVDAAAARGEAMALATIIGVRGSTYRRAGARLLITASGEQTGNISGGCLEGDVAVVAGEVLTELRPRVMMYDLTADDDAVWGLGLGCNGAIEVFIEPTTAGDPLWRAARATLASEDAFVIATVIEGTDRIPAGRRLVLRAGAPGAPDRDGSLGDASADAEVERLARRAFADLQSGTHTLKTARGSLRLFAEILHPPMRLIVCGAGHDAIPVVKYASQLGWRVVVVDRREALLTHDRFPGAAEFIRTDFPDAGRRASTDAHTAVLIMTHNYMHDRDLLRAFLPTGAAYLGMLGPRARTDKILKELEAEGAAIPDHRTVQIFGPVGLDIGSETPDEIAIAAIGEVLAVTRGRTGGFLRTRGTPIHTPAHGA